MKTILLWDPRFPNAKPQRLTVDDTVASAAVRAGVAAAADPTEEGALMAGSAVSPASPLEILLQHGVQPKVSRIVVPLAVARVAASAGVAAGIGMPIPPDVALPALTTSGAAYHAVYSNERLIPAFAGALARGIRPSDSAAIDLGGGGSGVRAAEVAALRGTAANLRIDKWYDQSGNGRDATQTVAGSRPALHESGVIGDRLALLIDGRRSGETPSVNAVYLDLPQALARNNCTIFLAMEPGTSIQKQAYIDYASGSGGTDYLDLYQDFTQGQGRLAISPTVGPMSKVLPSSAHVTAIVCSAGAVVQWLNGAKGANGNPLAASTMNAACSLGASYVAGADYNARCRILACVIVSGALSDADVVAVTGVLQTRFSTPAPQANLVVIGDSIQEGIGSSDTFNLWWYIRQRLAKPVRLYNLGIGGRTLAQCYADRATFDAALYDGTLPNVAVIAAGINDLGTGTAAATLYSGTLTPYVTYLKGLGYKVGIATVLPQTSGNYGGAGNNAAIEARRTSYNSLVTANGAAADFIIDQAADATMGVYPTSPNDTSLYPDNIHPSSAGCAVLAPIYAAGMNGVLA